MFTDSSRPVILTIDDSPENLDIMVGLLRDEYTVKVAVNGATGLRLAAGSPQPELILLDVTMPGIDGYEVCQKLKADPQTRDIPVIFLTSRHELDDEVKGFALGAVDYVTKPFRPEVVRARVRTHIELVRQKRRSDSLLANILPAKVIEELRSNGQSIPQMFEDVSVLFSDLVEFTPASAAISPRVLVAELTDIFTVFDEIVQKHGTQRIKTIGDAYLAVSGMPEPVPDHAERLVRCGLDFLQFLEQRAAAAPHHWRARVGIHSGPVVAGIVGMSRFQYDVFGDTVNVASRVQSAGEPMRLCISGATRQKLGPGFTIIDRGLVELKGKGPTPLAYVAEETGGRS